jgi:hypothetical protein
MSSPCSLGVLGVLDLFYLVSLAYACDTLVTRMPAFVVACIYGAAALLFVARAMHYYEFYRTTRLYNSQPWLRLPTPTSDLQSMLAIVLYSVFTTALAVAGENIARQPLLFAWALASAAHLLYSCMLDDRRALRAYVARSMQPVDPPTRSGAVAWSGVVAPNEVAFDTFRDDAQSDKSESLLDGMSDSRRRQLRAAINGGAPVVPE